MCGPKRSSSARAASEGADTSSGTGLPGATLSSLRTERMRDTSAMTPSTCVGASARAGTAAKSGSCAAVMASPGAQPSHSASVTKGMKGLRSCRMVCRHQPTTARVSSAAAASAPFRLIFANSTYQSQNVSRTKACRPVAASLKR